MSFWKKLLGFAGAPRTRGKDLPREPAHPPAEVRARTATARRGENATVAAVAASLDDPDAQVRSRVAQALVSLRNARSVQIAVTALRDGGVTARAEAVAILTRLVDACPHLEGKQAWNDAFQDGHTLVRRNGEWYARERFLDDAERALLGALGDPDDTVRQRAADWLAVDRDDGAAHALIALVARDDVWPATLHQAAARALGEMGEDAVEPMIAAVRAATQAPEDDDGACRTLLLLIPELARNRAQGAVEPLIALLRGRNALAAAAALGQIGDPRAVEPLVALYRTMDPMKSGMQVVAEALGAIGDARAVDALIESIPTSSLAEIKALGQIGDGRAVDPILRYLDDLLSDWTRDPDGEIRDEVLASLEKIHTPEAEQAVARLRRKP
jgi:HEAT repeat protein